MADPISSTVPMLALTTYAIQSVESLNETVDRFRGHNRALHSLHGELNYLCNVLSSFKEVAGRGSSLAATLERPIDRCGQICQEFKQTMLSFNKASRTSFQDWAKLRFMRGDINEFVDTVSGYKSTIVIGICTMVLYVSLLLS